MNNTRKLETSLVFLLKAILNLILFFVLYGIYAKSNWQLWNLSRTSGITIAAYVVMHYMFSTIYGHYDIGKRKSKPIVLSLFLNQVFTDVISVIVLSIMNTNQMKNQSFKLEPAISAFADYCNPVCDDPDFRVWWQSFVF